jgi:hypothetical protein
LRRRQRRRQPEADDLAANDGCSKHGVKLTRADGLIKRVESAENLAPKRKKVTHSQLVASI